VTIKSTQLSQR